MALFSQISRGCQAWAFTAVALALMSSLATANHIKMRDDGVAIQGYDPVAYFTVDRAVKGKPDFEYVWDDARWWFSTAEHQDMFARDPERYAPRFSGFCTGGLSLGHKTVADPENWYIIEGSLYLHHSAQGRDQALADPDTVLVQAEETWDRLGGE